MVLSYPLIKGLKETTGSLSLSLSFSPWHCSCFLWSNVWPFSQTPFLKKVVRESASSHMDELLSCNVLNVSIFSIWALCTSWPSHPPNNTKCLLLFDIHQSKQNVCVGSSTGPFHSLPYQSAVLPPQPTGLMWQCVCSCHKGRAADRRGGLRTVKTAQVRTSSSFEWTQCSMDKDQSQTENVCGSVPAPLSPSGCLSSLSCWTEDPDRSRGSCLPLHPSRIWLYYLDGHACVRVCVYSVVLYVHHCFYF